MKPVISLILLLMFSSASVMADTDAVFLNSKSAAAMNLPFSEAVRVGDVIVLSGQLGTVPGEMKLVEGGIEPETHQIFANIKRVLEENDSSLDKVFKCTVMMRDIAEWPRFNKIYVTYFPGDKPARSAFGANGLALGGAVEMECWATAN